MLSRGILAIISFSILFLIAARGEEAPSDPTKIIQDPAFQKIVTDPNFEKKVNDPAFERDLANTALKKQIELNLLEDSATTGQHKAVPLLAPGSDFFPDPAAQFEGNTSGQN
jgi:hypothetical protein